MNEQYVLKNVAFVVGALHTAINAEEGIELSRLALLMPLLMDDGIVFNLNDESRQYEFETLVSTHRILLANYNERYLSVLPLLYQAIALLLDIDAVSMRNGMLVKTGKDVLADMIVSCQCNSLTRISMATSKLLKLTEGKSIVNMYKRLNVEL